MAAKETGALQAAKTALEKQVEELTSQLQQEKCIRADIEEAKTKENAKLQSALQEMQLQFQETRELLIKEREAAKKDSGNEMINKLTAENEKLKADIEEVKTKENAKLQSALQEMQLQLQETRELLIKERKAAKKDSGKISVTEDVPVINHEMINMTTEETSVIQDFPVTDNEIINKLAAENEKLKALVSSLEKKIDETEKKYKETNKLSEERLKQASEAESKIIQLKTAMQRLEEKLSDIETEDQVLRHQALVNSPARIMSGHLETKATHTAENGYHEQQGATPAKNFGTESMRRSQIQRQHENIDALITCVSRDIGFSHGKPVAAFTIYKCLLHWKSFEAEKTSVFDRLIQMIGSAIENQDDNDQMAYWLSNTATLLFLLQKTLKVTSASLGKPPTPKSFFGRMTQGFRSSPSSANLSFRGIDVYQVEAKYPALLFKQQLTAYVETIYRIIQDNLKKDLSPLLSCCLQAPKTPRGTVLQSTGHSFNGSPPASHWQSITESLNALLSILKENCVPPILCQKMFTQIFSYINVQLFNSLVRQECCTFSNAEHVKAGLAELELWCVQENEEYAGSLRNELKHIRQAIGLLVNQQKSEISYDEITTDLCPILSVHQLYRVCTLYEDDKNNTQGVSPDVISSMKLLMTDEANDADNNSFLLDDTTSIPFSVDDITYSVKEKDFSEVNPAAELLENPDFQFLRE